MAGRRGRTFRSSPSRYDLATAASGQSEEDGGSIRTGSTGSGFAGRSSGDAAAVHTLASGPRRVCPYGSRGLVGFRRSGRSAGRFWSACGRSDDRLVRQGDIERLGFGGSSGCSHQHDRASGTKHWRRCDRHGARNHGNDSREQCRSALSRALRPSRGGGLRAGLGQALATTSNTVGVLSPLGGTSYATQLNFPQQARCWRRCRCAAARDTLNQQAPHGPTVHLDANVNVGVMFLADVRESAQP